MTLDYDEMENGLIDAEAGTRAAECHGFIAGYFCASNTVHMDLLRDHLVSGLENGHQLEQCYALINKIAEEIMQTLQSNDIDFQPLLPDDDAEMHERSRVLSEWCAGFVSGLGVGGLGEKPKLNDDCEEFIKDMVAISRMEPQSEEDEEAEVAFVELVEYIRVGSLMLYQEWHPEAESGQRPEVLH